jgi:hypothetical protein
MIKKNFFFFFFNGVPPFAKIIFFLDRLIVRPLNTDNKITDVNNLKKRRIQKATKSTSLYARNPQLNLKRLQQIKLLKEQQKPFDQFDLFPLDDDEEETLPLVKPIDFKISMNSSDNFKCLECGESDLQMHFNRSYTCHQCRYGTFCSKSYEFHLHAHLVSKRNALWNKLHKDDYLYKCECSFETNDGNLMALHMLNCDKKTCLTNLG